MDIDKIQVLSTYLRDLTAANNAGHRLTKEIEEAVQKLRVELGLAEWTPDLKDCRVIILEEGGTANIGYSNPNDCATFMLQGPATICITYGE